MRFICKLSVLKDSPLVVAFAGVAEQPGFHPVDIVRTMAGPRDEAFTVMARFRAEMRRRVSDVAASWKGTTLYGAYVGKHAPVVEALFASVFEGRAEAEQCSFFITPTGQSAEPYCYQARPHSMIDPVPMAIGQSDQVANAVHLAAWRSEALAKPARTIDGLVKLEIADRPKDVGGPVTVLRIDTKGVSYVNRGPCLER